MPPPPLYNDDDTSKETFQSCAVSLHRDFSSLSVEPPFLVQMRLYLRIEGPVLNVDMFEIEVVENIPFTKVKKEGKITCSF